MPIDKSDSTFRVGFRNINSLPMQATDIKNDIIIRDIRQYNFDVFGMAETNVAWQHVPQRDRVYDRFKGKLEFSKFVSSNNKDPEFIDKQQSGGTLTMCHGHACARVMDCGRDNSILGRWSWLRLRGSNGRTLRFVTVYRPVLSHGATSAYQQHRSVLLEQGIDECPRKKLMEDLRRDLEKWIEEGDQLLVAGDFNEDVRSGLVKSTFDDLNMDECIFRQHGPNAPNTFQNGSVPIDGIFGSKGIDILLSGYTSGTWGSYSDHRALWVDIDVYSTFGGVSAPLWRPRIRRLKLEDPRIVQKFIQLRIQHSEKHNLDYIREELDRLLLQGCPIDEWSPIFEKLDRLRVQGILEADRRCRRLKCGNIPWSPEVQQCMNRIGYLQACRRKLIFNKPIHSRTLQKLFKKTTLEFPITTGEEATLLLRGLYTELNLLKVKAIQLRGNFLHELAERKAAEGNGQAESMLKQLMLREEQRSIARAVKWALNTQQGGSHSHRSTELRGCMDNIYRQRND